MDEIQSAFTAPDWLQLCELPGTVVAAAATIEHDGGIGSTREIVAGLRAIVDGAELYLDNRLIQGFFTVYKLDGQGEERTLELSQTATPALQVAAIAEASSVTSSLVAKAPVDEALQFRDWVFSLADEVINSTATGGFLGIGGRRITSAEERFLADLAAALELGPEGESTLPEDIVSAADVTGES